MAITVFNDTKKRVRFPKIFSVSDAAAPRSSPDRPRAFRETISLFLENYGERLRYNVRGSSVWCTLLIEDESGVVFPLYTVKEEVKSSSNPLCDYCRCVGWGHHYVSKRRYHLIIPEDNYWKKPLTEESLHSTSHLLHGVIHCNGFGHLLSMNDLSSSGPNYVSRDQIMGVWDNLCNVLQTRKISLEDVSSERSIQLRLLHGVAYGRSWYGKWGYRFFHGSFGVTEDQYCRAIHILSSLKLDRIIKDYSNREEGNVIYQLITCYRMASETHLETLCDLLQFVLTFRHKAPVERKTAMALMAIFWDWSTHAFSPGQPTGPDSSASFTRESDSKHSRAEHHTNLKTQHQASIDRKPRSSFASFASEFNSRWSAKRLEEATKVVVKVLEEHKDGGGRSTSMNRQELRDAVRMHIGDTGLIDFLLKHIDKVSIGDQIVCRSSNPVTRVLEFSLDKSPKIAEMSKRRKLNATTLMSLTPGLDVYADILFLYENVLLGYPDLTLPSWAAKVILNSKHLVKEWDQFGGNGDQNQTEYVRVFFQVMPSHEELATKLTRPLPPGELVVVPRTITIDMLKLVAQCTLRDTYWLMDSFRVTEIRNTQLEKEEDHQTLDCGGSNTVHVFAGGCDLDLDTDLRYEGGVEDWVVDCICGAREDDGERMVACDSCKSWEHTRCHNIGDEDAVPSIYLCSKCSGDRGTHGR